MHKPLLLALALGLCPVALGAQPDLVVQNMRVKSACIQAGSPFDLSFVVRNQGTVRTPTIVRCAVRLSTDAVFGNDDVNVANVMVPVIQPGLSASFSMTLTAPYHVRGKNHVIAFVDADKKIIERIEFNNFGKLPIDFMPWKKDLRIEWRPTEKLPPVFTAQSISATTGGRLPFAFTATGCSGHWYMVAWSFGKTFVPDSATSLGLTILNTPVLPRWFGRVDSTERVFTSFFLAPKTKLPGRADLYLHAFCIVPNFSKVSAGTSNSVLHTVLQ